MARRKPPQPFFRQYNKSWYVQIGRHQINLGRDEAEARAKCDQIIASRTIQRAHIVTVAKLLDEYLDWCQKKRSAGTYDNYRRFYRSFVDYIGRRLKIVDLEPVHLSDWVDLHPNWSSTTQHDGISCVQRAFNWAVKRRLLDVNPISRFEEKPPRERREVVYTPEQWKEILAHVRDQEFRDLLMFLWNTGCRPFEARTLGAEHVDLNHAMVVFPPSRAKGKRKERVIYLDDETMPIVTRLCAKYPTGSGPIFRNTRGTAWTKDTIKCRLTRLKQKVKIDKLCAYGIRHSHVTEGLKNGVDAVVLAQLMGHSSVAMIANTYQHLAKNHDFLREQAKRAKGA